MRQHTLLAVALFFLVQPGSGQDDVIFAAIKEDQHLATRLNCRVVEEEEQFEYSSEVELWGAGGGRILIHADLLVLCLGADVGGQYGDHALKYNVRISSLRMTPDTRSRREKRGAKEFLSDSWRKVKQFFRTMFGRKEEPRTPQQEEEASSYEGSLYSVPFQMVQLANGSIPELRFSENEVEDGRVRNFKRHLADAFSTHLSGSATVLESTVMGQHTALYNVTTRGETSNLNVAGWSEQSSGEVVVEKSVTEEDIVELAPSEALNDRHGINLRTLQKQIFLHGRMISSSGSSSFNLLTEGTKHRDKREADQEDAALYLRAHSSFHIQWRRRRRRSVEGLSLRPQEEEFRPVSRVAESEDRSEKRKELLRLHKTANFSAVVSDLLRDKEAIQEEDILESLSEVLDKEARLKLDEEQNSLSSALRHPSTLQKIKDICSRNFPNCKDYLHLLALAGGPQIEMVFGHLLEEVEVGQLLPLCGVLQNLRRPSVRLLRLIGHVMLQRHQVRGGIAICLTNLASGKEEEELAGNLLLPLLEGCGPDTIDFLEAVGNLRGDSRLVSRVIQVCEGCADDVSMQIACVHALRPSLHLPSVQEWAEEAVRKGECDLLDEVVGALLHSTQETGADFNIIDTVLEKEQERCPSRDIPRYFRRKREGSRRRRRALWEDVHCEEWPEGGRPIQGREEFAADRATYSRRKSCLASRTVGIKGSNAEIYAGMFAGVKEGSSPPKYKLFTKFATSLHVLDYETEVASFYFYLNSGNTRAYVRVMGKTRQEFSHDGCTPTDLQYRPLKHVPLYSVSIANLQLSLGLQLGGHLSLDTLCPAEGLFLLRPRTHVRVAGEALGTALFVRGGASLGADFNYNLQFMFTPSPNMCLNGSHGFDPMNVNFESFFQLWNAAKEQWGRVRSWKPNLMFWRIREGQTKPWFKDMCISPEEEAPSARETE